MARRMDGWIGACMSGGGGGQMVNSSPQLNMIYIMRNCHK